MAVILTVLLVQVTLHLLNIAGDPAVNNLLWSIFTLLPSSQSKEEKEIGKLRAEVVRLHREMSSVSAQDDFAKWARLRREHDKAKDKYDKAATNTRSFRATFDRIVGVLRFLFVQGFNFVLNSYYAKTPMFWLPQGWVPYQVEWIVSCPRAPLGSISVNVWGLACGSVIALVSEGIRALWTLHAGKVTSGSNKGEPLKHGAASGLDGEKKEL